MHVCFVSTFKPGQFHYLRPPDHGLMAMHMFNNTLLSAIQFAGKTRWQIIMIDIYRIFKNDKFATIWFDRH